MDFSLTIQVLPDISGSPWQFMDFSKIIYGFLPDNLWISPWHFTFSLAFHWIDFKRKILVLHPTKTFVYFQHTLHHQLQITSDMTSSTIYHITHYIIIYQSHHTLPSSYTNQITHYISHQSHHTLSISKKLIVYMGSHVRDVRDFLANT